MNPKDEVISRLVHAKAEAERFLSAVDMAIQSVDVAGKQYYSDREFAAAKRASLDLSRKLVCLRKSLFGGAK